MPSKNNDLSDMKIIDISWPLSAQSTSYKNRKTLTFEEQKNFAADGVRETKITIDSHAGTHVDAPSHFLQHGHTVDRIALDRLVGPCTVLDLTDVTEKIDAAVLEEFDCQINAGDIILFKTTNSAQQVTDQFNPNFVYLDASGAQYLSRKQVKAVGIDYLGIERNQPGHETHVALLQSGVAVVEGLRLEHVEAGAYFFCCLPVNFVGLDGAPARAILLSNVI